MNNIFAIIICFIAGMGAGLGTGFAGLSAAAVISPMLITFLDFNAYVAIGIALASDVLASAVSSYTYGKSKNIDIKKDNTTKYGEQVCSEFAWLPLDKQKEKAEKFNKVTKKKNK